MKNNYKLKNHILYLIFIFILSNQHCNSQDNNKDKNNEEIKISKINSTGLENRKIDNKVQKKDNSIDKMTNDYELKPPKNNESLKGNYQNKLILEAAEKIKLAKNIIVMTGAGISVSCGIPDFRSKTGIFQDIKKKYPKIEDPKDVFGIKLFKSEPHIFYDFMKQSPKLISDQLNPSFTHYFISYLQSKGLLRHYTQNIDGLGAKAGIKNEKTIQAHGGFNYPSYCCDCRGIYQKDLKTHLLKSSNVIKCNKKNCSGYIKPGVVFYGERLAKDFYKYNEEDFKKCGLLIIIGTSLDVSPFSELPFKLNNNVPILYLNLEKKNKSYFNFKEKDIFIKGKCDETLQEIAKVLGWDIKTNNSKKKNDNNSNLNSQDTNIKPGLNLKKKCSNCNFIINRNYGFNTNSNTRGFNMAKLCNIHDCSNCGKEIQIKLSDFYLSNCFIEFEGSLNIDNKLIEYKSIKFNKIILEIDNLENEFEKGVWAYIELCVFPLPKQTKINPGLNLLLKCQNKNCILNKNDDESYFYKNFGFKGTAKKTSTGFNIGYILRYLKKCPECKNEAKLIAPIVKNCCSELNGIKLTNIKNETNREEEFCVTKKHNEPEVFEIDMNLNHSCIELIISPLN